MHLTPSIESHAAIVEGGESHPLGSKCIFYLTSLPCEINCNILFMIIIEGDLDENPMIEKI